MADFRNEQEAIAWLMSQGGSAFPFKGESSESTGMTQRDYFAGQALAGVTSNDYALNSLIPQNVAEWAYQFADSMLAARKGEPAAVVLPAEVAEVVNAARAVATWWAEIGGHDAKEMRRLRNALIATKSKALDREAANG